MDVYASRVLFIDSRKNPPLLGMKVRGRNEREALETRRQEIIIRLDCFSSYKQRTSRVSERDQNQNGMFETSLTTFFATPLPFIARESVYALELYRR